jgi:hypothetical protein
MLRRWKLCPCPECRAARHRRAARLALLGALAAFLTVTLLLLVSR